MCKIQENIQPKGVKKENVRSFSVDTACLLKQSVAVCVRAFRWKSLRCFIDQLTEVQVGQIPAKVDWRKTKLIKIQGAASSKFFHGIGFFP